MGNTKWAEWLHLCIYMCVNIQQHNQRKRKQQRQCMKSGGLRGRGRGTVRGQDIIIRG